MIYLYVGLGMAMLLPIMVGLQTAVSVSELQQGEVSFQRASDRTLLDWNAELELKSASSLSAKKDGEEIVPGSGYVVRVYGDGGRCLIPKGSDEKCLEEYPL